MFTIADIRNIAIQIEKNGEETYRNAAKVARNPVVARLLDWMADEERQHAKWFESIRSTKPLTQEQRELEEMGRLLLQDMIKGNQFLLDRQDLESAGTMMEVFAKSKKFERETIIFYEFLSSFLDDEKTSRQMKTIIEEERQHIKKLEHMEKISDDFFSTGTS